MPAASTPPFLLWAVGYRCPIRGFQDGSDPEMTERHLRAAVATCAARREGRIFEGYAVDESLGFRVEEALTLYGGLAKVEATCGPCPANAVAMHQSGALAGCVGMFVLPANENDFFARVEASVEKPGIVDEYSRLFAATQPRWFGFWIHTTLMAEQMGLLASVFGSLRADDNLGQSAKELCAGLFAARDNNLAFHATLYPRGAIENNWWRLVTHCPRCRAEWKAVGRGCCKICGYEGHPAPNKKRRARGRRPYLPLARLMGEDKAAEFFDRYRARRGASEAGHVGGG